MPKFSVIIPVYSETSPHQGGSDIAWRGSRVQRAIRSVQNQQFPDWELIVVDDGSCDGFTPDMLDKFAASDTRIKIIHKINENRAIALNQGMEAATGDWICWLDSDDEYATHYLRELDAAIEDFPEYNIFNFGALVYWQDHSSSIRPTFYPREEDGGHEWFRSGHIGAGSFIFRRDLWASDSKYRMPDEVNPYQFAAASKFDLRLDPLADQFQYENVENPDGAFSDGVYRHGLSLGNPWGQDFLQFYLLTRDNLSKPLDILLYIQYARSHEERYKYYGEIYDPTI